MTRCKWVLLCLFLPCLCGGEEIFLTPSVQVYDRAGAPVRGLLSQQQTYYEPVTLDEISPFLISATIAAEDKRFYTHPGVDVAAIMRALWQNSSGQEVVSGASTITQQLARNITPRPKNLWGKTQEAAQAARLEQTYTKEEILEQYFNRLEFGNLTQGVQAASKFYFAVDANQLSLSQAAFLAGLIKSPTYYNPLAHMNRALKRRDYVLTQMYENSFIDREMYLRAKQETITLHAHKRPFYAAHFTQWLATLLPAHTATAYTPLDRGLQQEVEQIIKNNLARLTDSHVTNAAVIVLENDTGGILAYAGSADFKDKAHSGEVDGVRALRQPGSALKPFVYFLAIARQKIYPSALLDDTDTFFEGGFRPRNYDENFHGAVAVRTALACSYNIPAVKVAEQVGAEELLQFLHQLGFKSLRKNADFYGLGLALGNGEVMLLELTNAYATLARGGIFKPVQLSLVPDVKLPGAITHVLDEKTAYIITDILKDNQARAPAFGINSPLHVPFEMAAKTGTSKDYKDNLALGYTPRWTIGVWVGNFDSSSMQKVSGITGAGPILHDVALAVQAKYPSAGFTMPSGMRRAVVCNQTGLLASPACTHTHEEVFDNAFMPRMCNGKHVSAVATRIVSPKPGDKFVIDPSFPRASQQLQLSAECAQPICHWEVDAKPLPETSCQTWWPLAKGKHTVSVQCSAHTAHTSFEVLE